MPHSGRPSEFDGSHLKARLAEDGRQTAANQPKRCAAATPPSLTISSHLDLPRNLELAYLINFLKSTKDYGLTRVTRLRRPKFCTDPSSVMRSIISMSMNRGSEWVAPGKKPKVQPDFYPNKLMFSVWWDFESLLHWELLPMNRLVYFTRLHRVGQII